MLKSQGGPGGLPAAPTCTPAYSITLSSSLCQGVWIARLSSLSQQ